MYSLVRPLLFCMEAEKAHHVALEALRFMPAWCFAKPKLATPIQALGYQFPHPLGLAAGLDKNGEYIDALAKLGFSFIEVGTVTPKPQQGNPKPRLFRLPKAQALINRMGFNNRGVEYLIQQVKKARFDGVLGINIGKNKDTPLVRAVDDYLYCLQHVYAHASYVAVNISSPNTPDLRKLQQGDYFKALISQLREEQLQLTDKHQRYVPLVIKLSPDEDEETLKMMAETIVSHGIDGIIATNTTSSREQVTHLPYANEAGGLSGKPLVGKSTEVIRLLKAIVGDEVSIIGVGGIDSKVTAKEKLAAGASLVQVYTGLIYQGPGLVGCVL